MIIYLDIIIFLNFIINYCFMQLIYMLFHEKENIIRIILSSIISVILLLSFLLNYYIFNFIKIIGGIILILFAFKYTTKRRFIINVCLFYLLQFSFIGILSVFNISGCFCLLILLVVCLFVMIIFKRKQFSNQYYNIELKIKNKQINITGFLDTGNVASYCNKPIIFLDKKYYNKDFNVYTIVNIKTINGIEYINCYKPEYFYINDNKISKDVLIAFTKFDNDINCLLNGLLFN